MSKATKRQMIEREEDIRESISLGLRPAQFAKDLARKHNCSETSIIRQYRDLIKQLADVQKEERENLRAELLMRADYLYSRALESGNNKNALEAINLKAKIGGVYQPEKQEKKEVEKPPVFRFKEREPGQLAVVPKDDDDRDAGNS